ncbi:MAG TPA: pyridoxal-phosphate dependent enzyme, partial [Methanoregulaceae archaeon]|nr:pyridoxal-phosphate dependent enzyme [Methanoregulaceae archaeon]
PSAVAARKAGGPVTVVSHPTIADGIRVTRTGEVTWPAIRDLVDEVVVVDDNQVIAAITVLLERKKVLAEGAGAAPLAALLSGGITLHPGEQVVAVISGGNLDSFLLERVIRKGLFDAGKLLRCTIDIEEEVKALPALLSLIANEGAIISRIEQERGSPDLPLSLNRVTLEMELRGPEHGDRVLHVLRDHGYRV